MIWRHVWRRNHNLFLQVIGLATLDFLAGLIWAFGPAKLTSSSSYNVLRRLVPIRWAGLILLICGLSILLSGVTERYGMWRFAWSCASVAASVYAFCLIAAFFTNELIGVPASACYVALAHFAFASEDMRPGPSLPPGVDLRKRP